MHIFTFPGTIPFRPLVFSCHPLSWQLVLVPELLQGFSFVSPPLLLCCSELVGLAPIFKYVNSSQHCTFALQLSKITQAPNDHQPITQLNQSLCASVQFSVAPLYRFLKVNCAVTGDVFSLFYDTVLISTGRAIE
jgi:hypothetical protein